MSEEERCGQNLTTGIRPVPQLRRASKPLPGGHFAVNAGLKSSFLDSANHLLQIGGVGGLDEPLFVRRFEAAARGRDRLRV
jgi:hypothetical protein